MTTDKTDKLPTVQTVADLADSKQRHLEMFKSFGASDVEAFAEYLGAVNLISRIKAGDYQPNPLTPEEARIWKTGSVPECLDLVTSKLRKHGREAYWQYRETHQPDAFGKS